MMGGGCTVGDDLNRLIEAGERFAATYADPPLEFETYSEKGKGRSADRHYRTQSLDEIKAVPVQQLAADDCVLFLWAQMPQLPAALEVIEAWGFEYKTVAFVWVKQNPSGKGLFTGCGYWSRGPGCPTASMISNAAGRWQSSAANC